MERKFLLEGGDLEAGAEVLEEAGPEEAGTEEAGIVDMIGKGGDEKEGGGEKRRFLIWEKEKMYWQKLEMC